MATPSTPTEERGSRLQLNHHGQGCKWKAEDPDSEFSYICEKSLQPRCSIDTETDEGYRMRMLFEEGLQIFISCKEGFQVIGNDRAECVDGKWNPEIQMTSCSDVDECQENSQHCGGVNTQKACVNTEGGFTCDCDDGYRLDRDSDLCLPQLNEEDEYEAKMCSQNSLSQARITCEAETVEGVTWNKTQANCSSPWIPCPGSSYGIMKRKCDVDGTWLAPDTTECTSALLHEKLQDVSSINTTEAANDHMGGIDEFLDERKDAIYGGDLRLSAQILIEIANLGAVEFPAVPEEKSRFVDFFLEIASKLLDGGKEDMWKNIHLRKGYDTGVLVIFEAIETFGRSMAKQNDITAASTKNIGMKIELISSNRMSKRSVENSENACNGTCLILPSYLLHRNASDELIVVTFKYRNPADLIVPPESVGTGRKVETRTWVDTITATKIVKRVNTEVISVSMFDNDGAIKALEEPITIEFEPKELGYGAKCSYMQYGDSSGVWKTDGCTHVQTSGPEVICKCDHLTNFAVVMAIGKEPVPFVLEARYGILLATDYIAIVLMVITLITIGLSRLLRDRYFVLGNMAASFILLPLSVVLNLSNTTEGSSCTIIEFIWHVALLGNFIWMAFYSVQQFVKLKFYVLSNRKYKLIYGVIGWVVPMVYSMFWVIFESQSRGENSCLHTIGTGNLTLLGPAAALVIIVVTLILLRLSFRYFDTVLDKYDPIEIEQIWEETHCGMFLVMSMMGTWMFQFVYIVTDSLLSGYLYAGAILTEGSTVFLAVFATNHELLQSARVKLFGDEEEREALGELRETEDIRNAMRKDIDKEITTRKKRIEDTLRMKAMKEKQRADVIVNAFSLATRSVSRQQHRQVAPVEEVF
ncbi:adhesion G protein-coupled receptor L4-like isoform X2 [Ptychodera flava]|uniref:adhesion G protein-coupled receptor L4-like isoform X2 n=1 Tax=Ptychodera flava TaxID=63121 RepID=UPI00396A5D55